MPILSFLLRKRERAAVLARYGAHLSPMLVDLVRGLAGVRYERLDPTLLFCGGPTIMRAVERLAEIRAPLTPLPFRGGVGVGAVTEARASFAGKQPPPPAPPLKGRGEV
jgi:hypothetical protein